MKQPELFDIQISDISSTMLLTLYTHAIESQSKNPVINDPKAVEITLALNRQMVNSPDRMYRDLGKGKLDRKLIVFITLRAKKYRWLFQRVPQEVADRYHSQPRLRPRYTFLADR